MHAANVDIGVDSMAPLYPFRTKRLLWVLLSLTLALGYSARSGASADVPTADDSRPSQPAPALELGPGDTVAIKVFGQPDMDGTSYVADDGTIHLPLVGSVQVAGLSPSQVSLKIERALKDGAFLVNPHVSVTLTQSVSQLVSVLGEIARPGTYQVNGNTTIFQLLALAGGATVNSADVIFLIRSEGNGNESRYPISLKGYNDSKSALPSQKLKGGDSVFIPRASQFFIYGEVQQPNEYRLESGMTVVEAIARAGGLTPRGSDRRVDIKRKGPDGRDMTIRAKQSDPVQANDVIHVKESIF
jgi:polysaccharide biosynthesis/export protein